MSLMLQRRPRRFGADILPQGRYYTVSSTAFGTDLGALVNELRAYRATPTRGMTELIDFGLQEECNLLLTDGRLLTFPRSREIGVVVHQPQAYGEILKLNDFEEIKLNTGSTVALGRFPYSVTTADLRVVDLRLAETRRWFEQQFSKPDDDFRWPESLSAPLAKPAYTMKSPFEILPVRAPSPTTFFEMLPTLLNPLIGGGNADSGGMTLMAIGLWLRNRGVEGLIYPSARNDVRVLISHHQIVESAGWCLVDLRLAPGEEQTRVVAIDQSPWSWTSLPHGVSLSVVQPDSEEAGSFAISGVVDSSAAAYVERAASLRETEETLGPAPKGQTLREAFSIGTFAVRWLHLIVLDSDLAYASRLLRGLLLRNCLHVTAGQFDDILARFYRKRRVHTAFDDGLMLAGRIEREFSAIPRISQVIGAAIDLEMALMALSGPGRGANVNDPIKPKGLIGFEAPEPQRARIDRFLELVGRAESNRHECILLGLSLATDLAAFFATQTEILGPLPYQPLY